MTEQDHLARAHRSSMTQEQRKELFRIVTMGFSDEDDRSNLSNDAAVMTDRQLNLTWLRMCDYISEAAYRREFDACIGKPLFEDKPAWPCKT